jgi:hypothetical protein
VKGGSILGLIIVLGVSYYLRTHFAEWITTAVSSSTPTCFELVGSTTSEDEGVTNIVGSIRNNCTRKYLFVQIVFTLDNTNPDAAMRDRTGGSAVAVVRDLEPGDTSQFKTVIPVPKDASFRLEGITAY